MLRSTEPHKDTVHWQRKAALKKMSSANPNTLHFWQLSQLCIEASPAAPGASCSRRHQRFPLTPSAKTNFFKTEKVTLCSHRHARGSRQFGQSKMTPSNVSSGALLFQCPLNSHSKLKKSICPSVKLESKL